MDWKSVSFDWNRARAFLVTAEEGSLSNAARALKLTQSTLGRQVAALEAELGVTLFERVGRGLEITPSGLELIEHVRTMAEAANRLSLASLGKSNSLVGSVAISATEANAVYILPTILKKLRQQEPGIEIELVATNSASDLRRREADIAIRNFQPTHSELIARKLKDTDAYLYATNAYIERIGSIREAVDLSRADFIGFTDNTPYLDGLKQLGLALTERNFPYTTQSHAVHWSLVKEGLGIGVMPEYIGDKEPTVRRVLASLPPFPIETWIVAHRELRNSRRIRRVFDFLVEELSVL